MLKKSLTTKETKKDKNSMKKDDSIVSKKKIDANQYANASPIQDPKFGTISSNDICIDESSTKKSKSLNKSPKSSITQKQSKGEKQRFKKVLKKKEKWAKIFSKIDLYTQKKPSKFRYYIYKGISEPFRGGTWKYLLMKKLSQTHPDIMNNFPQITTEASPHADQITKDVNRTYTGIKGGNSNNYDMRISLFNVLNTYSLFDKEIGYTQGMNEVASLLLQFMSQQDAVECFIALNMCEEFGLRGLYIDGLPLLKYLNVFISSQIYVRLHSLKKHFDKVGYDFSMTSTKWIMCLFVQSFPEAVVARFWDVIVSEGTFSVVYITLALLVYHRRQLMKLDMEGLAEFFQTVIKSIDHSIEELMDEVRKLSISFKNISMKNAVSSEISRYSPKTLEFREKKLNTIDIIPKEHESDTENNHYIVNDDLSVSSLKHTLQEVLEEDLSTSGVMSPVNISPLLPPKNETIQILRNEADEAALPNEEYPDPRSNDTTSNGS